MARFIFNGTQEEFAAARAFIEADAPVIDFIATVDDALVVWSQADLSVYDGFAVAPDAPSGVVVRVDGQVL